MDFLIALVKLLRAVEKAGPEQDRRVRQRRSRPVAVFGLTNLSLFAPLALMYSGYAPRANGPAALPVEKGVLAPLGLGG